MKTHHYFLSDNGPNGNRWNNELKERKGSTNEGGVRVPFFIQWPNKIKPGKKLNKSQVHWMCFQH